MIHLSTLEEVEDIDFFKGRIWHSSSPGSDVSSDDLSTTKATVNFSSSCTIILLLCSICLFLAFTPITNFFTSQTIGIQGSSAAFPLIEGVAVAQGGHTNSSFPNDDPLIQESKEDPMMILNEMLEMSKVLNISVLSYQKKGRAGHQLKDTGAALALAVIFKWNYVVLPDTFEHAHEIIDLEKVSLQSFCPRHKDSIDFIGRLSFGKSFGNWESFEGFIHHVYKRFRYIKKKHFRNGKWHSYSKKFCVALKTNWRVNWPQIYEWESYGYLPKGTYMTAIKRMQQGFYYDPAKWKKPGTTAVVHWRRGDTRRCCVGSAIIDKVNAVIWESTIMLMDEVAKRHDFKNCDSCRFHIITEPDNSEHVFAKACSNLRKSGIKCEVTSTTLLDDFMQMVASDIFVMASSSLSHWAALLGKREHVYLLPGLKAPHDVWNGYLSQNPVDTTGMGFQQTCFAFSVENHTLYDINCTRPVVRAIVPRANKLD